MTVLVYDLSGTAHFFSLVMKFINFQYRTVSCWLLSGRHECCAATKQIRCGHNGSRLTVRLIIIRQELSRREAQESRRVKTFPSIPLSSARVAGSSPPRHESTAADNIGLRIEMRLLKFVLVPALSVLIKLSFWGILDESLQSIHLC